MATLKALPAAKKIRFRRVKNVAGSARRSADAFTSGARNAGARVGGASRNAAGAAGRAGRRTTSGTSNFVHNRAARKAERPDGTKFGSANPEFDDFRAQNREAMGHSGSLGIYGGLIGGSAVGAGTFGIANAHQKNKIRQNKNQIRQNRSALSKAAPTYLITDLGTGADRAEWAAQKASYRRRLYHPKALATGVGLGATAGGAGYVVQHKKNRQVLARQNKTLANQRQKMNVSKADYSSMHSLKSQGLGFNPDKQGARKRVARQTMRNAAYISHRGKHRGENWATLGRSTGTGAAIGSVIGTAVGVASKRPAGVLEGAAAGTGVGANVGGYVGNQIVVSRAQRRAVQQAMKNGDIRRRKSGERSTWNSGIKKDLGISAFGVEHG